MLQNNTNKPVELVVGDQDAEHLDLASNPTTIVRIGAYDLAVSYASPMRPSDLATLRHARNDVALQIEGFVSRHLDPFPSSAHELNGDFMLHRLLSTSELSRTFAGVHIGTGRPFAIKRWTYRNNTAGPVWHEIDLMESLGGAVSTGVLGPLDIWCKHESKPCSMAQDEELPAHLEDELCCSMPLPEYHFRSITWSEVWPETRLRWFRQTLRGLGVIHSRSVVHRFIEPASLVLVPIGQPDGSYRKTNTFQQVNSMEAAISELSFATPKQYILETHFPANIWTAPEVESCSEEEPYSYPIDVWSLGLSWLDSFHPIRLIADRPRVTTVDHAWFCQVLNHLERKLTAKNRIYEGLFELMKLMLKWDPSERPTVFDALDHHAWNWVHPVDATIKTERRNKDGIQDGNVVDEVPRKGVLSEIAVGEDALGKDVSQTPNVPSETVTTSFDTTASEDGTRAHDEQPHDGDTDNEEGGGEEGEEGGEEDDDDEEEEEGRKEEGEEAEGEGEDEEEEEEWNGFPVSPQPASATEYPDSPHPVDDAETPDEVMGAGRPSRRARTMSPQLPDNAEALDVAGVGRPSKRVRSMSPHLRDNAEPSAEMEARWPSKKARLGSVSRV